MKSIIILAILLIAAISLAAHPASSVKLSYDAKTQVLTVNYEHSVKNPVDHYIDSMVIKIAGKERITQLFSAQESATGGSLVYKLPGVKSGTVIEAVSSCNKMGKKSAKLTIQ
ncbi:MAG: hypothetical protein PHO32_02900 [Candidatus Cloacimonetes bacterium]|nr:hypothetical protein [Candidatus Cloacimonadota bacterium]